MIPMAHLIITWERELQQKSNGHHLLVPADLKQVKNHADRQNEKISLSQMELTAKPDPCKCPQL